jgi:hypothetical protein
MKKNFLWAMMAAAVLMSCNPDKDLMENRNQVDGNAVAFSTYVNKSRASVVDTDHIKLHGFAVNAYYTGLDIFEDATQPGFDGTFERFMDNTKVSFNKEKGTWTYSPVKYWPNTEGEQVSFFAYAPYNCPQITFPNDDNRSTLLFSVNNDVKQQVDLVYHKAGGDAVAGIEKSIDLQKPTINSTINLNFLHALSRISFNVKAVVDDVNANSDNLLDGNTRINIRKLALITADDSYVYEEGNLVGPFYTEETLNTLNGEWGNNDAQATQGFEFDGDEFYRAVDVNDTPAIEGDDIVQLNKFNTAQRLLNNESYLMIIPQNFEATDGFRIYIEYDVISEEVDNNGQDNNIISDNSTITNKIYSDVMNTNFVAGKAYAFNLYLGMTSVKFDANVTEWPAETNGDEVGPDAPNAPTGLFVESFDETSITLSWNANDATDTVVSYNVYRGEEEIATGVTGTTYTDAGLMSSTDYCYTVKAVNQYGYKSAASLSACATTEDMIPAAPETLNAAPQSSTTIVLTWSSVYDAKGYIVYRNNTEIARVTETTYTDSELVANETYCYKVKSVNNAGESEVTSMEACATTSEDENDDAWTPENDTEHQN